MLAHTLYTTTQSLAFQALNLNFGQGGKTGGLPGAAGGGANPNADFGAMINQILNIVLVIAVIAVLFYLILGAIEWLTSGGDSGKTAKAREKITGAVIGLVITMSVVAIMMFVQQLLGICVLNFSGSCGAAGGGGMPSTNPPPSTSACSANCLSAVGCAAAGGSPITGACGSGLICCSQ